MTRIQHYFFPSSGFGLQIKRARINYALFLRSYLQLSTATRGLNGSVGGFNQLRHVYALMHAG